MPEILKPCPFCGAKAIIHHDLRYPKWSDAPVSASEVICINYECPIYKADNTYYLSDEDAIKAWNRRASNENL